MQIRHYYYDISHTPYYKMINFPQEFVILQISSNFNF